MLTFSRNTSCFISFFFHFQKNKAGIDGKNKFPNNWLSLSRKICNVVCVFFARKRWKLILLDKSIKYFTIKWNVKHKMTEKNSSCYKRFEINFFNTRACDNEIEFGKIHVFKIENRALSWYVIVKGSRFSRGQPLSLKVAYLQS